jgi:hypothetical protein
MTRPILVIACGLLTACAPRASTVDPRSAALAGIWCLAMDDGASNRTTGSCASVALVAVRRDAEREHDERLLLAEGAISMFEPVLGERLPDGTPVQARATRGDSVTLEFAAARGDYQVYLAGVLRGDTLKGRWRSVIGRSSGSGGAFIMARQR